MTGFALLWCGAFTLQPLMMQGGPALQKAGALIYLSFSPVCHQIPERSLAVASRPMAVCSHCAGIYYGGLVQILLYPLIGRICRRISLKTRWLGLAALPFLLDYLLTATGMITPASLIRVTTGFILGLTALCYILPGATEWLTGNQRELIKGT